MALRTNLLACRSIAILAVVGCERQTAVVTYDATGPDVGSAADSATRDGDGMREMGETLECEVEEVTNWPFPYQLGWTKPFAPPRYEELTKAQLDPLFAEASPPFRAWTTNFAPHHEPGNEIPPYVVWAQNGEALRVSYYLVNVLEPLDDHRAYLSILVDYEPVAAEYVRWLEDRGGQSETIVSTGIAFDIEYRGELVDVELPASLFEEQRTYEITAMLHFGRPGHKYVEASERYALFHEGYTWPDMPCFSEAQALPLNEDEDGIANNIVLAFKDAFVRAPGVEGPDDVFEPIAASPGEVIELDVSLFNQHTGHETTAAAMPFLEGRPVGPAWFYRLHPEGDRSFTINRREKFALTMPDEPGTYDFHVAIWRDAMLPAYEPDRRPHLHNGHEVLASGTQMASSSNMVRFVVE